MFYTQATKVNCPQGHPYEGHEIRLRVSTLDSTWMKGTYYLIYAGWDEQWIVKNEKGMDMLRCDISEVTERYLVH